MPRGKRRSDSKSRSRWVVLGKLDERDVESLAAFVAPDRPPSRVDAPVRDADRATRKGMQLLRALDELSLAALRDDLDSLAELGEIETLRLQMAMDRLSKMTSTLSNILKKTSDTAAAIAGNLK